VEAAEEVQIDNKKLSHRIETLIKAASAQPEYSNDYGFSMQTVARELGFFSFRGPVFGPAFTTARRRMETDGFGVLAPVRNQGNNRCFPGRYKFVYDHDAVRKVDGARRLLRP
jgi:hypothetical protein